MNINRMNTSCTSTLTLLLTFLSLSFNLDAQPSRFEHYKQKISQQLAALSQRIKQEKIPLAAVGTGIAVVLILIAREHYKQFKNSPSNSTTSFTKGRTLGPWKDDAPRPWHGPEDDPMA